MALATDKVTVSTSVLLKLMSVLPVKVGALISVPSTRKSSVTDSVLKLAQLSSIQALRVTVSAAQVSPLLS